MHIPPLLVERELVGATRTLHTAIVSKRTLAIDISTDKEILRVHKGAVTALDCEAVEGRYLLSGGGDGSIYLYDLEEPVNQRKVKIPAISSNQSEPHRFAVTGLSWYPFDTGMFFSSSFDNTVRVWDTNTMQEACLFDLESMVYSHALSPIASHGLVATAAADPRIRLCDLRSGAFTHSLPGHRGAVVTVRWSPSDEFLLASGGTDQTVRFWDIRKSKANLMSLDQHNSDSDLLAVTNYAHNGIVNGLTFSPDGQYLISTGTDEQLRLWDMADGRNTLVNYGQHLRNRCPHALLPAVTPLQGCSPPLIFQPSDNHCILVFSMHEGELLKRLKGPFSRVTAVVWRPGREELYSASYDEEVLVWSPVVVKAEEESKSEREEDEWSSDSE